MKNAITSSPAKLIPQITLVIPGITSYGAILGFPETYEATLTAKKAELVSLDAQYEQGKLDLGTSRKAKQLAITNGRNHFRTVRELLRPTLTSTYSQLWDAFGFTGSLALPNTVDKLVLALTKLGSHLTANPALGVAESNLVAAKTLALENALTTANAAVNQKKADRQRLHEDRAAKAEEVRFLMREVLSTLRLKLTPLDSRWVEFGLNKPGAQPIPPVPEGVTAVLIGTNAISIKWPAVVRAEYCRIWARVIGVDEEMRHVGTSSDLDFLLEQLPGNSQVEIALSAVNNGGESGKSAVIVVQTL
ncbi:MAG: fibronectin type III domain-containing protein [Verrucomicrobia bacterium]|nr:fibronectin type III domain-containing protein [Verrucomicrobiota bacterium]